MGKLPSFFVVGAQKAGTTTLHNWLLKQPDVCLPRGKETHFFSDEDKFRKGVGWYLDLFPPCEDWAIRGEICPGYIFSERAPINISKLIKSPRLVFIYRNPVERAYSHYRMSLRRGYEKLPFDKALLAENERMESDKETSLLHFSYMARGRYCEQINRYRAVFPGADMLHIKFDELFGEKTCCETYKRICKFIRLQSEPMCPDVTRKWNSLTKPRSVFFRDLMFDSTLKKIVGSLIPSKQHKIRIGKFLDWLNRAPIKNVDNDWLTSIPDDILEAANKEVLNLQALTGLDLQDWIYKR